MGSKRRPKSKQSSSTADATEHSLATDCGSRGLVEFHLNIGWWMLLLFVILGVFLETLHGFKVAWYLNVGQESRRLLWRLAHAHGTFLAIVNIAFAATIGIRSWNTNQRVLLSSRCLLAASVLVPLGFFLGGTTSYAGDPGVGIVLLPIGALLLIAALGLLVMTKSVMTKSQDKSRQKEKAE